MNTFFFFFPESSGDHILPLTANIQYSYDDTNNVNIVTKEEKQYESYRK